MLWPVFFFHGVVVSTLIGSEDTQAQLQAQSSLGEARPSARGTQAGRDTQILR